MEQPAPGGRLPFLKGKSAMGQRPSDIGGDQANTYFIYAAERNAVEIARLIRQTQLSLELQGELFPDQIERITDLRRILDVACGPGAWAIEVAKAYPDSHVVGFDIGLPMIEHAQMFAEAEGVTNVEFLQMDATRPLEFPDGAFDLVNASYLYSFMTPSAWPVFLQEGRRILRPGGIVKISELEVGITSRTAGEELYRIWAGTMKLAGRSFSCDGQHHGTTAMLRPLLRDAGYDSIGHKAYALDSSYGSPYHQAFLEDLITLNRHMQPFVRRVAGEDAFLRQQVLLREAADDIRAAGFTGIVYTLTAWGVNPGPVADGSQN
jgi:ubiquinone/menaquinone biosynthesis C-methylase UbiE